MSARTDALDAALAALRGLADPRNVISPAIVALQDERDVSAAIEASEGS